ncbi:MAG TPA: hypothetical protein VFV87_02900 [Pirellulaceae bacterium]|nr:hypothetical protein [Pirellulaceae bacterium]
MPSSARQPCESGLRIRIAPEEVSFTDWPLRQRPGGSLLALALAGGVSWLVGWAAGRWEVGAIAAAALAFTLWQIWLPVRYEIDGRGIAQLYFGRWRRRIPWSAIRQYEVRSDGVLLVPDAAVTPLSPLRGLYLHWGAHREEVLANLEYYVHSWRSPAGNSIYRRPSP